MGSLNCDAPAEIQAFPSASIFSGGGISDSDALFSYQANWESAGRWNVEVNTNKHRLIFRPMERLQVQNIGSTKIEWADNIDYSLDEKYKSRTTRSIRLYG